MNLFFFSSLGTFGISWVENEWLKRKDCFEFDGTQFGSEFLWKTNVGCHKNVGEFFLVWKFYSQSKRSLAQNRQFNDLCQ